MRQSCYVCRNDFEIGFTIGVLVSSCGKGKRQQKYQIAAAICQKCGNAPGGRKARPKIWAALRDAASLAIAHIANVREVLTLSNK